MTTWPPSSPHCWMRQSEEATTLRMVSSPWPAAAAAALHAPGCIPATTTSQVRTGPAGGWVGGTDRKAMGGGVVDRGSSCAGSCIMHHPGPCIIQAHASSRPMHHPGPCIIQAHASSGLMHHPGSCIFRAHAFWRPMHHPGSCILEARASSGPMQPHVHHPGACS